jgi:hypothetical protein
MTNQEKHCVNKMLTATTKQTETQRLAYKKLLSKLAS